MTDWFVILAVMRGPLMFDFFTIGALTVVHDCHVNDSSQLAR
jgi:hypothetical protein